MNYSNNQNVMREQKQFQLIQDMKILASLKNKNYVQKKEDFVPPNTLTNFSSNNYDTNGSYNINHINFNNHLTLDSVGIFNNNNNTNLSYYQDGFFEGSNANNKNSRNPSLMSYKFDGIGKEMKYTSDSFYKNFVSPFKGFTNMSYGGDFLQNGTGNITINSNQVEVKPIIENDSVVDGNNFEISEKAETSTEKNDGQMLGKKKKIFLNFKNKKGTNSTSRSTINSLDSNDKGKDFCCEHNSCSVCYKTKKQKISHHNKMTPECKSDTISLLRLIRDIKKIIFDHSLKYPEELKKKYEDTMKEVSLEEHVQIITGYNFDKIFTENYED